MIAKATVVSYGGNAIRYSADKEEAEIVKVHHLPPDISASGMWTMMNALQLKYRDKLNRHRPMVNTSIRIEVSPTKEESVGWTLKEWRKLADMFIREFDAIDLSGRAKRDSAKSINLRNSQYVVSLHHDSDSGILHLHINANRIDMDGNVNDAHFIHERVMEAAKQVSIDYGWVLAEEIRKNHINTLSDECEAILEEMRSFSWQTYEAKLKKRGYDIEFRRDNKKKNHRLYHLVGQFQIQIIFAWRQAIYSFPDNQHLEGNASGGTKTSTSRANTREANDHLTCRA